jgi:hypothetical protein
MRTMMSVWVFSTLSSTKRSGAGQESLTSIDKLGHDFKIANLSSLHRKCGKTDLPFHKHHFARSTLPVTHNFAVRI